MPDIGSKKDKISNYVNHFRVLCNTLSKNIV